MMGVSHQGELVGIELTKHAETPGLGAKATEPEFQDQFDGKNRTLENTDWAVTKDGGDFDAILGATITVRAITKALEAGLKFYQQNQEAIFAAPNEAQREAVAETEG